MTNSNEPMRIPESELILNARGSVYHLDLLTNEIADTIITVGDPERVKEVSKHFDRIRVKKKHREFVTHTGVIGKKKLTVISTGIGTDNIDIVLTELDALVNIDLKTRTKKETHTPLQIIRIGTSGSLQKEIPVDSFVASSFAIGMDNLMNFYTVNYSEEEKQLMLAFREHMHEEHIAFIPYVAEGSQALLKIFDAQFFNGITVTCPGFYGPQGRVVRAENAFPHLIDHLISFQHNHHRITNFEMETSGIYGMAKLLGHEAISLSAIVANRVEQQFSKDADTAIERLITAVIEKLV